MPPRAVLFDLDDTLVDSAHDIAVALDATLVDHDLPALGVARVRGLIGDGAAELVRRAWAEHGAQAPARALDEFRARYAAAPVIATRAYDGIVELLRDLRPERRLAIVTNKPQSLSEAIADRLGLTALVDAIVGPERVRERKPSRDHVIEALAILGSAAAGAALVGDGPTDAASGRDAGVRVIGVTWGYRPRAELEREGTTEFAHSVADLRALLAKG